MAPLTEDRPVNVAVVGMSYWGPNLARNFDRLEGSNLRWACDLDEGLLEHHRSAFPLTKFTTSLDEVLADPETDAVIIATPVPTHARLALAAIAAGKHVFVEKPLALTTDDARAVAEAAEAAGVTCMVDHLLVLHPAVTKVKELVDTGHLGDVHYLYGNRLNLGIVRKDENALWSLGPHDISVMLHIVGEPAVEVSATGASYLQEGVEDVVFGRILFASGTIGHLHLSWLDPHKMRRMTVIGSDRMVVFDDMESERKITVYDKGPVPRTGDYGEYIQVRSGDIFSPKINGAEPLKLVCQHFLDCIRSGEAPIADGWAGLATVEVLEAMDKSLAENGRPVTLEGASA